MNRRQRKKAFKKKYGMNPVQFEREIDTIFESATKTLSQIDWKACMQALAEAMNAAFYKVAEALERTGQLINTPEFQEELKRAYALRKQEEEQMSKEDALEIGLAINAIATLLDDRSLAKVERYLKRIEEIALKYVPKAEAKDESSD